ncbi:hypothetical protein Pelo_18669 [Pelomyxa schiedti]|nr:hypothetical protein Pelo_18669 [Pelomyxa schiedti]
MGRVVCGDAMRTVWFEVSHTLGVVTMPRVIGGAGDIQVVYGWIGRDRAVVGMRGEPADICCVNVNERRGKDGKDSEMDDNYDSGSSALEPVVVNSTEERRNENGELDASILTRVRCPGGAWHWRSVNEKWVVLLGDGILTIWSTVEGAGDDQIVSAVISEISDMEVKRFDFMNQKPSCSVAVLIAKECGKDRLVILFIDIGSTFSSKSLQVIKRTYAQEPRSGLFYPSTGQMIKKGGPITKIDDYHFGIHRSTGFSIEFLVYDIREDITTSTPLYRLTEAVSHVAGGMMISRGESTSKVMESGGKVLLEVPKLGDIFSFSVDYLSELH